MKVIYALWGEGLESKLLAPSLHEALRTAGATRLQVNVDDADVAPAKLRITSFDAPVRAVVAAWVDGEPPGISRHRTQGSQKAKRQQERLLSNLTNSNFPSSQLKLSQ